MASARRVGGASVAASPHAATSKTPSPRPRAAQLSSTTEILPEKLVSDGTASTRSANIIARPRPDRTMIRGARSSPAIVVAISALVAKPAAKSPPRAAMCAGTAESSR